MNGSMGKPSVVRYLTTKRFPRLFKQRQQRLLVEIAAFGIAPATVFEGAGGHPAFTDHDAMGNADQFDVGEHRARS